ncbi:histidine kinase dimerization/phosphoacceptor domain -containing protein [Maribacter hydrothermalis]|uniref:histidine kinase n=1 Tax=Maribacter hydrothermalis TaxID=1836467 RepID=A0A1B7ZBX3_9FLAO|nr:histidine kinase dimerization/phosphoacceptor domain -containing protein [Maribacter hydrothermalis]APQ15982.1 histidine kinase [Maribacter hydrothermalis]OBR40399.1 histidine kinase [Maribacter hydrothermalis]
MRVNYLKIYPIILLSLLGLSFSYSQIVDLTSEHPYKKVFVETDNFGTSYLDTLEHNYKRVKRDSLRWSMLNDLAYYWHSRNLNKAITFTREGLRGTRLTDSLWHGRFQITQGAILLRLEKLDSAQLVLEDAKKKVRKTDLAFLNTQLGYVYERRGQLDSAADYALKSLELGKEHNDTKAMAMAYSDLSNLFWKQSKFESGVEYGLRSLELFEAWGITDLDYDFTLYVTGNNYLALEDYEQARKYYEQSIIIGERYGFYNNLSDVYISLVDLYSFLEEFEKAMEAGSNAVKYAELLENNFMIMRSWLAVGKLQNKKGNYKEAIEGLKKSILIATKDFGDAYYLSDAYKELGSAYAKQQDYKNAFYSFSKYDSLKNEVFTAEADHRISELRTEFDVAKKENTIALQEIQIKKQQSRQQLIIIISFLLLLLLLLAYKAISNNSKKNKLLQKKNSEKEFLLKEIHHRVKNNLEIVSSLLSLQASLIEDPKILNAMEQSQHRVHSMGMIHQKLYLGEKLATIEMKDYFNNLSDYILHSFGKNEDINILVEMDELELDVDMAIPIGLIVNELITNSLKYAFPNNRKGTLRLALTNNHDLIVLKVSDDGIGMPNASLNVGTGFGTQLVNLLVKQLDGKMVLLTEHGTTVNIQFQNIKAA